MIPLFHLNNTIGSMTHIPYCMQCVGGATGILGVCYLYSVLCASNDPASPAAMPLSSTAASEGKDGTVHLEAKVDTEERKKNSFRKNGKNSCDS